MNFQFVVPTYTRKSYNLTTESTYERFALRVHFSNCFFLVVFAFYIFLEMASSDCQPVFGVNH